MSASAGPDGAQLFVIDPIERLNPAKDSSVALMQAAQRAALPVWICTPADISAAQQLGQLLRSTKDYTGAAKAYTIAIERLGKLEPEDWQLFYYLGIAYERAKN